VRVRNIFMFIDANDGVKHRFQPQGHNVAFKMDHGFHVDDKIDWLLRTFMENCRLDNILAKNYGTDVLETHSRGSIPIVYTLTKPGQREFVKELCLLDFKTLCHIDHREFFWDLVIN
jgi:hypothetical protein